MGLFFWRQNKVIDPFAHAVADELYSFVPPNDAQKHLFGGSQISKKEARKIDKKLVDAVSKVSSFSASNSLGIYGKARLQQKLNERLEELGYPSNVVARISEIMLTRNV